LQEDLASGGGGDDAFEAYCAEVEGTAAWGGQVELQVGPAALHALRYARCARCGVPAMHSSRSGDGR
jgi:hypothetical protein